jgi:polar amino acid transport system substrate-binding protein
MQLDQLRRREFITLLVGASILPYSVWAQQTDPRVADLVRAGKVRVALFLPLYAKDPVTGELRGNLDGVFLIEIIHALAARLGVETQLVGYPTPPEAMNAIKAGACDVGFFGIDPVRAAEVDFSPPLVQEDYTYLMPAGSSIHSIADSDRPGIRIAVVRNHASTAALSRVLKHAELVYAETPDTTLELLRTGQAAAMASARPLLLLYSDQMRGSRVLEDRYGALILAMVVRKDQPGRLAYISEFVEEAKASGLVKRAVGPPACVEWKLPRCGRQRGDRIDDRASAAYGALSRRPNVRSARFHGKRISAEIAECSRICCAEHRACADRQLIARRGA